jgi:sugar/nucleoside kinase (ribokinase family)
MTELYIKYSGDAHRENILKFLSKEKVRFDIDVSQDRSLTNRIIIELSPEDSDSFISYSKFKGFKFYET